jgi:hypothetical protein
MEKRECKFMTCCPDDTYFTWQVHLWLDNLKQLGKSEDAVVLLFIPVNRMRNSKWNKIIELYPETTFKFYKDDKDEISRSMIPSYISVLRPWLMREWFKENPEYGKHAIFYCDSDILFTKGFNIDSFVDDDTNYLSDTNSYISITYFDNKRKEAIPERVEEFKEMDVFGMLGSLIGITREQGEKYKNDSGGAQYLMKNLDAKFWDKVMKDCMIIRAYLQRINKDFFKSENHGYQSWCADMWAVLWNLWFIDGETKVIPEMGFAWSTDQLTKLEDYPIMHNAGVTAPHMGKIPYFYKGKYHQGADPTVDPHLEEVLNNEVTKTKANWFYANALKELKQKYNLNY